MENSTAPATVPNSNDLTVDQAAEMLSNLNLSEEEQEEEESETQEADQTEDDASPDEESDSEDEAPTPTYKVKVNGKDVEVTLDELQKGYSLQSDYTRKTQELAEQRKAADAEAAAVRSERAHAAQLLQALQMQLQQAEPQIDWDNLYQTDPLEYLRQKDAQRERQEKLNAIQLEQQRIAQAQQHEAVQHLQKTLQQETTLLIEKIPAWKDEAKAKAERELIKQFAVNDLGFSAEDVNGITDHRVVLALRKAWLFDAAMSKRQGLTQSLSKTKIATPNAPVSVPKARAAKVGELRDRVAKSGSVDDAARYFSSIL